MRIVRPEGILLRARAWDWPGLSSRRQWDALAGVKAGHKRPEALPQLRRGGPGGGRNAESS